MTAHLAGFYAAETSYANAKKEEVKLEKKSLKGFMSFASNVIKKEIDNIDKAKNQKTEPKIETSSQKVLDEFR